MMIKYKNLSGKSGVSEYLIGDDFIKIKFITDDIYVYTYASARRKTIDNMKSFAQKGKGLSTYISQIVKEKFEH